MQDSPGDVAVLPAGMFRIFDWAGDAPVLDPAPRLLPSDVLQTGDLVVRGETVHGEGTRATAVQQLLLDGADPAALADLGVAWVLVERSPGPLGESQRTLDGLDLVFSDDDLALYRVPGATQHDEPERAVVIAGHLLWAALLAGGLTGVVAAGIRQRLELVERGSGSAGPTRPETSSPRVEADSTCATPVAHCAQENSRARTRAFSPSTTRVSSSSIRSATAAVSPA